MYGHKTGISMVSVPHGAIFGKAMIVLQIASQFFGKGTHTKKSQVLPDPKLWSSKPWGDIFKSLPVEGFLPVDTLRPKLPSPGSQNGRE